MRMRFIEVDRALWGAALLAAPRAVLTHVHGVEVDRKAVVVARILGARHLVQAALSGVNPSPEVLAAGVWVDSVHSLAAFALAATDTARAPAAITDGIIAAVWARFAWHDLKTAKAPPPSHQRRRDDLARLLLPVLPGGKQLLRQAQRSRRAA